MDHMFTTLSSLQVNHLINRSEVTATERFLNLSDTCELGNMPRLSHYCLEDRLRSNPLLCNDVNERVYTPIANYYSGTVVDANIPEWLEATSIPPHQRHRIESTLMQTYSCTSWDISLGYVLPIFNSRILLLYHHHYNYIIYILDYYIVSFIWRKKYICWDFWLNKWKY